VQRLACFALIWLMALGARADETKARELFGAGVEAILAHNWSDAVRLLEASLAQKDKPACRFNLVIANRELHRPLEVARHAVAFLATVEGRSHAEEAAEVRTFLADALHELVTLQVDGLPLGAQLKVDGAPPRVMDGSRIYDLPGLHRLELWIGESQLESIDIVLAAGAVQPWPRGRALRDPAAAIEPRRAATDEPRGTLSDVQPVSERAAEPPPRPSASMKKTLAYTLGLTGAAAGLTAVVTYGFVAHRGNELRGTDSEASGYLPTADRYARAQATIMPLAFVGGALMASASVLAVRKPRAALAVSITALVLGVAATSVGAVLMARTPETLVDGTDVTSPSRQAGSLCLGAALPLLTFGARLQWDVWRGHQP
jgi:hypothetical protein